MFLLLKDVRFNFKWLKIKTKIKSINSIIIALIEKYYIQFIFYSFIYITLKNCKIRTLNNLFLIIIRMYQWVKGFLEIIPEHSRKFSTIFYGLGMFWKVLITFFATSGMFENIFDENSI